MPAYSPREHLRAVLVLAVFAVMWLLAFPGLDVATRRGLRRDDTQRAMAVYVPKVLHPVVEGVVGLNEDVRGPIVAAFTPLERTFRIRQNWSVYRAGPPRVGRLEVWVDGALLYRSADPEHRWRRAWLANRHVRPAVDGLVTRLEKAKQGDTARALVVELASRDFPDADEVVIVATASPYPGLRPRERAREVLVPAPEAR